jgi:peptidylprolyl isomerase
LPAVATKKSRQRQLQNRHARIAAAAAARDRARRRRWFLGISAGLLVVLVAVAALLITGDDDGDDAVVAGDESTTTTAVPVDADGDGVPDDPTATSAPATESAAGKPCVDVADELPAGAPEVPVQVGPPPTELITEDLAEGDGATVVATDTVTVQYIGVSCSTGTIFDSSYSRGQPATFPLNQVIPGWTEGIPGMKVGGRRLLGIPSEMAYGASGRPPEIAPDEALWFVVEVVDAQPAAPA